MSQATDFWDAMPARSVLHYPYYGAQLWGGVILFNREQNVLTPQEMVCSAYAIVGYSDKQTGAALTLSDETIGTHLRRSYHKLGAHNRAQILPMALHLGVATVERQIDPLDILTYASELDIETGQLAGQGLSAAEIGAASSKPTSAESARTRLREFGNKILPEESGFSHHAICGLATTLAGFVDYPFPPPNNAPANPS